MVNIEIIIGYIIGGVGTLLALFNFLYTWLKTQVKGPDFRINKLWEIKTNPVETKNPTQCYFGCYHLRWNYGDRSALFQYKMKVKVLAGDKYYSNETSEETT